MNEQKQKAKDVFSGKLGIMAMNNHSSEYDILSHALDSGECWENLLDERELKELEFGKVYAADFAHGTAGHNRLMLIAKLYETLDVYESALHNLIDYIDEGRMP